MLSLLSPEWIYTYFDFGSENVHQINFLSKVMSKLWGGCFSSSTDPELEKLNASINLDKRMFAEDVYCSQAYAQSLNSINLLTNEETKDICDGLEQVKLEWERGTFTIEDGDEDIHTANERRLKSFIGEPATKLHVGRSRNDQVITDMKLWLKSSIVELDDDLRDLIDVILTRSSEEIDILMPSYTHLQRAQPMRWSHWLLSHAWNFKADTDRLEEIFNRTNVMPLGSGALAGTPFNIDRQQLAHSLGFDSITQNSMHAVGDRDFIAEFLFWASLTGIHLSRLAEDLIIYSTKEFNFVRMDDLYSTGSSLMPQKKNPDSLELIRGVGASIFGQCCSFMMVLKGLPTTYNKDLQCDKETMFAAYDKLDSILKVACGVVKTLKVIPNTCKASLSFDMLATDLAYYLVKKGIPFREAHHFAGKVVAKSDKQGVPIHELTLADLKSICDHFDSDVEKIWNFESSVEQYQAVGGTSRQSVLNQIGILSEWNNTSRFLCKNS